MKRILVTGVARGIGRSIAEKLISNGYFVYGVYKENVQKASMLEQKFPEHIKTIKADLANPQKVSDLIKELQLTKLDGIVNNAGIVYLTPWEKLDFKEWDETLAVNLTAPLKLVHGLRMNLNQNASIVNVASVDAYVAAFDTVAYAVSKAGLISLTKSLGALLGPTEKRLNAHFTKVPGAKKFKDQAGQTYFEITPIWLRFTDYTVKNPVFETRNFSE